MSSWHNYRTIIESPQAKTTIDGLKNKYDRFEDQWDGFIWLASRTPEEISLRQVVGAIEYRLAHRGGDMTCGLPDFAVVYTYDADTVEIIDVAAWDSL